MSRGSLESMQRDFVEALRSDACVFEGVPTSRMVALRESLMRRRIKHMLRLAPALDAWLGPRFETMFRARLGGDRGLDPLSDLLSFAAGLACVPDDVAIELMILRGRSWTWLSTRRSLLIVIWSLRIEVPLGWAASRGWEQSRR